MAFIRSCDLCGMARQKMEHLRPVSAVARYNLQRQVRRRDGKIRPGRVNSVGYTKISAGGIDICEECLPKFARSSDYRRLRACDNCHFARVEKVDGREVSAVHRYSLSRQRKHHAKIGMGGISLCDECWGRLAKPKMRPDLKGKTGPAEYRGRVTAGAVA